MSLVYRGWSQSGPEAGARALAEGSRGEGFPGQESSSGQIIENSATSFLEQAFDPAALAAMAGAGVAFQGGRLLSARLAMKNFSNPIPLRTAGMLGGFAVEVPAFVAASKGAQVLLGRSVAFHREAWAGELMGAALILGALKLGGLAAAGFSRPLQGQFALVRPVAAQVGMFGGIYAGHHLEGRWLQGQTPEATTNFYKSLLTLFQFNLAGAMLPYAAPGLHRTSQGLNLRTEGEILKPLRTLQMPTSYAPAFPVGGGKPGLAMMSSSNSNGGRGQLPLWMSKLPKEFFPESRDLVEDGETTPGGNRRVPQGVRQSNQLAQLLENLDHPKFRIRIKAIRELANQSPKVDPETRWEIGLALLEAATESITPVRKAALKALPKVMANFENPGEFDRFLEQVRDFASRFNIRQLQSLYERQVQPVRETPEKRVRQFLNQLEAGPSKKSNRKLKQVLGIYKSLPDRLQRHRFAEALVKLGHRFESWRALGEVLHQLLEQMPSLERKWVSFTSTLLRNPEPEAQIRALLLNMTPEEFGVMDYNFRSEYLRDADGQDIPLRELPPLIQDLDRLLSQRRQAEQERSVQSASNEDLQALFSTLVSVEEQGAYLGELFRQGRAEVFAEILQSLEPAYRSLVQREVSANLTIPENSQLEMELGEMSPENLAHFEEEARKAFLYDGEGGLLPLDQVPLKVRRLFQTVEARWNEMEEDPMNGGSLDTTVETAQYRDAQWASGAQSHPDPIHEREQNFLEGRSREKERLDALIKGFEDIEKLDTPAIFERIDRYLDALEEEALPVQEAALKLLTQTFAYLEPRELEPALAKLLLRIPQLKEGWNELDPMDRPLEISRALDSFLEKMFFQELSAERQGLVLLNFIYERAMNPGMDLRKVILALETRFIDSFDNYLEAMPEIRRSDSIYEILDAMRIRRKQAWSEIETGLRPPPARGVEEEDDAPGELETFVREETAGPEPKEVEEVLDSGEIQMVELSRSPEQVEVEKEVLGAFARLHRPERRIEFVVWYFFNRHASESTREFLKIFNQLEARLKPQERGEAQQRIAARMVLEQRDVMGEILSSGSHQDLLAFRDRMLQWLQAEGTPLEETPPEVRDVLAPIQEAIRVSEFARTSAVHRVAYEDGHRAPSSQDPMFLYGQTPEEQFARVARFTQRPPANSEGGRILPLSPIRKNFGALEAVEVDVQAGYDRVKHALDAFDPAELKRMSALADRTADQPWLIAGVSDGIGLETALALMASGMMRRGLGVYKEPESYIHFREPLYMKRLELAEGLRLYAQERGVDFPILFEDLILADSAKGDRPIPVAAREALDQVVAKGPKSDLIFFNSIAYAPGRTAGPGVEVPDQIPSIDREGRVHLMSGRPYRRRLYQKDIDAMGRNHGLLLESLKQFFGAESLSFFLTWANGSQNTQAFRGIYGGGSLGDAKAIGEAATVDFHLASQKAEFAYGRHRIVRYPAFLSKGLFAIPEGGAFGLMAQSVLQSAGHYQAIPELVTKTFIRALDGTHNLDNPAAAIELDAAESLLMPVIKARVEEFERRVEAYREEHPQWDGKPLDRETSARLLKDLVGEDYLDYLP